EVKVFKKIPIHPILLSIYPILFLYTNNISLIAIDHIYLPIALSVIATILIWLIINLSIKNRFKSSVITSLIVILFFSYGHIIGAINKFPEKTIGISSDLYLSINFLLILLILIYWIVKYFKNFLPLTGLLNFVSFALMVYPLIIVFTNTNPEEQMDNNIKSGSNEIDISIQNYEGLKKPDIYYIILDGYGRGDVLKSVYGYDNEKFLSELEKRGFFIARKSNANYAQTTLFSLASSLNMEYLDAMNWESKVIEKYTQHLSSKIKNNRVAEILRRIGYKFVTFSTGYTGTEIKNSDLYFSPSFSLDEFENMILNTTPFHSLLQIIPSSSPRYLHRQRIIYTLDQIPKLQDQDDPIFVFAHIVAPHPPFVLAEENEFITLSSNDPLSLNDGSDFHGSNDSVQTEYKTKYIAQLQALNHMVLDMLDRLLLRQKDNLIIVLQSDHGPAALLNLEYPDSATYAERVPILNAYFFPDSSDVSLYDSITPVNTFRLIFNNFFNSELELLEDKSYFSKFTIPKSLIPVIDSL
ncbi:MAG: sulfatase-like hydrolase/transferase, partial [Clostridiaceae bacterium]|nr:sulfatase-like hydrolase/transferase [Clostridiaceae bacterium]